ncbi:MAG TPA: ribosome biogenesis factor YjgA [Steroidobacteraceae bacterium]|nr:ribosome biogenesis factor YjgA [Steroidobacteraceae bacterium]
MARKIPPESAEDAAPSKSARKRTALAAQQLGEQLIALSGAELAALELPEPLLQAVQQAQHIPSRSAGARQRQYIGRLMRDIDQERIRAALAERGQRAAREGQRFRTLESWRERLIAEPGALEALAAAHPGLERTAWQSAIAAARAERQRGGHAGAGRVLFRMLRELLDAAAE